MSKLLSAPILVFGFLPALLLGPLFQPMELSSAGDVPYPPASVADGVVVLRVAADKTGKVTEVSAARDIGSLSGPATTAVQSWKFRPAVAGASVMTVAVVFRPAVVVAAPAAFDAVQPEALSEYTPPGIRTVAYPDFPVNGVAAGTVVLQVAVDQAGRPGAIEVIRGIGSLTSRATQAVKKWGFSPAKYNGKAIPSKIAIAFVFRLPVT